MKSYCFSLQQLPVGHAEKSLTEAQGNPNDYEYVCENGGTVPITGPACTWAQRPWPSLVGNKAIKEKVIYNNSKF